MKDIKRNLKDAYREVTVDKLLFDNAMFYKRLDFWVLMATALIGLVVLFFTYDLDFFSLYFGSYLLIIGFSAFLIINRENKRKMQDKKMKSDPNIVEPWYNEDYEINKQETFYKTLISKELLNEIETDIELLKEYELLCEDESSFLKSDKGYLFGGGVIILFILPVWGEIINRLFSESLEGEFMETLKLIFSLITTIYLIVYFIYNINKAIVELANSTSKKYKSIGRLLRLIRLNLMRKNYKS